jgi:hypothetical protein
VTETYSFSDHLMDLLYVLLLITVLLACWMLTLVGMPGNWLMVVATAIYAYFMPATLGWKVVVVLAMLAALGEIVELWAGAMGVSRLEAKNQPENCRSCRGIFRWLPPDDIVAKHRRHIAPRPETGTP